VTVMAICLVDYWEESKAPLKNFIKSRVSNEEDIEDILQDVFLKLISNIDKLMDNKKVHAWLYRITRNAIIDYYRKNHKNLDLDGIPEELPLLLDEDLTSNKEIAYCLKNMVDKLPEKYKQAIIITVFENHTQKEYSQMVGISLSCAKSRVQRARDILKEMVLGCCSLEFDSLGNIINYKKRSSNCQFC
jgi:RNA polymerase sigma-70 factor (ECF subfamily)